MQAAIRKMSDGSVALKLDAEAARAVFASVLFAARIHEGIAPLATIARKELDRDEGIQTKRGDSCR